MDGTPDLVVRDGYLPAEESLVDVVVADGAIVAVGPDTDADVDTGGETTEIDAGGMLVSPGLADAHVHLDMAFSAGADRLPRHNDGPGGLQENIDATGAHFETIDEATLEANVEQAARMAVANGVVHVRSHSYVDGAVGTKVVEAVERVRGRLAPAIDVQTVSFPQRGIRVDDGSLAAMEAGVEAGADLVGGLDPATRNGDREETVETWFDVAVEQDAGLDVHVHEDGAGGMETLEHLAAVARERGWEDRVAASHAFALPDAGDRRLANALESFADAGLGIVTCYQSTPPAMPVRRFDEAGWGMAGGTDQIRTLWSPHGNADALEAMLVESLRLEGRATNDLLAAVWRMVTANAARELGIDGYGIEPGTPADLVVHDAASPHRAVLEAPTPRYVIKEGRIVAEAGTVVADCFSEG